ncbi:hypothetical protein RRG08_064509 [Elysia crispata]|uniref:Uncharacterized protein n=1 Tax=Elysia crispata TaxID=231223 RepID=A0AAE1AEX6_9GAST|nr:hypothetical protein RRG08_064509 [Elysia crispata]
MCQNQVNISANKDTGPVQTQGEPSISLSRLLGSELWAELVGHLASQRWIMIPSEREILDFNKKSSAADQLETVSDQVRFPRCARFRSPTSSTSSGSDTRRAFYLLVTPAGGELWAELAGHSGGQRWTMIPLGSGHYSASMRKVISLMLATPAYQGDGEETFEN